MAYDTQELNAYLARQAKEANKKGVAKKKVFFGKKRNNSFNSSQRSKKLFFRGKRRFIAGKNKGRGRKGKGKGKFHTPPSGKGIGDAKKHSNPEVRG